MTGPGEIGEHNTLSLNEYTRIAIETPGVDPLQAEVAGAHEGIPAHGYLISASLQPGLRAGTVDIEKYDSLTLTAVEDESQFGTRHGVRHIHGIAHRATLRCGEPEDVLRSEVGTGPSLRTQGFTKDGGRITELGDRIVLAGRMHVDRTGSRSITTYDPARDRYIGEHEALAVSLVRTVRTVEEATGVLASIARGLGLHGSDFQGFMNAGIDRLSAMVHPDTHEYHRLKDILRIKDGAMWLQRLGSLMARHIER